jgi:hypothetical protein
MKNNFLFALDIAVFVNYIIYFISVVINLDTLHTVPINCRRHSSPITMQ